MKQQGIVPDSDLQHSSTKYTTAQSKADAVAKAFADASDTDSLPADRQQFRREMEATFTHPVPDDSLVVNTPLTCTELRRTLASIKKVSLHRYGVDTVSYLMLREAPESFLKILLDLFQRCWDGGHNSRWVETRHCRPHPQTRQIEEGARQLQTHLPDIPPTERVRPGDQEPTRIPL